VRKNIKSDNQNFFKAYPQKVLLDLGWKWWKTIIILVFILFLALILRLAKIFIGEQPIFADEAIYVRWAQVMKAEPTLRFLPLSDGKQPFYMWILMFLLKPGFDPLIVGRLLSAVFGIFTEIGVFVFSYIIFRSKRISLIATLLCAISPFLLFFESMALVDSTLTMRIWFIFLYAINYFSWICQ
jgi:hypothetical protein